MGDGDRRNQLISLLRGVALVLLLFGFSGWAIDDGGEVSLESPFTIVFAIGLVCAIVAVYLGVFLANGGD